MRPVEFLFFAPPALVACTNRNLAELQACITDANINNPIFEAIDYTPLACAIRYGWFEGVTWLLKQGALLWLPIVDEHVLCLGSFTENVAMIRHLGLNVESNLCDIDDAKYRITRLVLVILDIHAKKSCPETRRAFTIDLIDAGASLDSAKHMLTTIPAWIENHVAGRARCRHVVYMIIWMCRLRKFDAVVTRALVGEIWPATRLDKEWFPVYLPLSHTTAVVPSTPTSTPPTAIAAPNAVSTNRTPFGSIL